MKPNKPQTQGFKELGLIPIFMKASRYRMSHELPFSMRRRLTSTPLMVALIMTASEWGKLTPSMSYLIKVIGSIHLGSNESVATKFTDYAYLFFHFKMFVQQQDL